MPEQLFFTLRIGIKFAVKTKEGEGRALSEVNKDKSFAWMLAWTKTIASKLFTPLERISHPWHTFQWHEGWIPFLQKNAEERYPIHKMLNRVVRSSSISVGVPPTTTRWQTKYRKKRALFALSGLPPAGRRWPLRAYGAYLQYWCITSATNEWNPTILRTSASSVPFFLFSTWWHNKN